MENLIIRRKGKTSTNVNDIFEKYKMRELKKFETEFEDEQVYCITKKKEENRNQK